MNAPSPPTSPTPSPAGGGRAWRTDSLPFEERPFRQYVWLSGEAFHSGVRWRRDHWGLASIRRDDAPDGRLGYRQADIDRLEAEGDMDPGTAEVFGWLPALPPAPLSEAQRDAVTVNAVKASQ